VAFENDDRASSLISKLRGGLGALRASGRFTG